MPSFTIKLERKVIHTTEFTIEAKDEDAAQSHVKAIFDHYEIYSKFEIERKLEWDLDDETFEVLEVNED